MAANNNSEPSQSILRGPLLDDEPGIGAQTLPGYLREVTERYGDAEALVMHGPDGILRWSYNELWQQSMAVARALIAQGVGKDSRVGILMTNRPEYLSALFGTAMAGGVAVVLSTFSTADELRHLLKVSSISTLLFEDRVLKKDFASILLQLAPELRDAEAGALLSAEFPWLRQLIALQGVTASGDAVLDPAELAAVQSWQNFLSAGTAVSAALVDERAAEVYPGDPGGLFFSSGTTSQPKGILHSQRAFAIQFWRWPRLWKVAPGARSWTGNGFFWSGPMSIAVGCALSSGGTLVLQPLFDADAALALIQAERVSLMNGRPHQWARMQASPNWDSTDLSSLRQVTKGDIFNAHPTASIDWQTPNAFGTTETNSILTSFASGDPENNDATNVGPPLPGNVLKIIEPLTGAVVPMGDRGEICVKGPTLMSGYLGKTPEQCFDEAGFYRTGDGGYFSEGGHLIWEGRLNDIIKTGGANVSPQEIDTAIAAIAGVKRTQTVGVPHDMLSEMVVACIVAVDGAALDEAGVIAALKERLASFKVPRRVLFFREEDYPLTANEKVKAGELRELAMQRISA